MLDRLEYCRWFHHIHFSNFFTRRVSPTFIPNVCLSSTVISEWVNIVVRISRIISQWWMLVRWIYVLRWWRQPVQICEVALHLITIVRFHVMGRNGLLCDVMKMLLSIKVKIALQM